MHSYIEHSLLFYPKTFCLGEETPSGSLDNAVVPDASKPSARTHSDVKQVGSDTLTV